MGDSVVVMRVTVTGDLNGEYIVEEIREDGRVVLRPDTSAEAINRRQGLEPITAAEFDEHFGHLPVDDEQQGVTSYPAIIARAPGRPVTAAEFEEHFGDLPTDNEP